MDFDGSILIFIQEHIRCGFLDAIFPYLTHLGDAGIFWIVLTIVLLMFKKTRKAGLCSACALLGSLILNNLILKPLVNRTRPYEVVEGLRLMGKMASDASFPSGHTAASFASATALFPNLPRRYGVLLVILAFLIAFSRLYIGIHYPTDVLVGFLDGILLGILANVLVNKILQKCQQKKAAAGH